MAATNKSYPSELKERGVRLVMEWRRARGRHNGGLVEVGEQLGVHPETLRVWVNRAAVDAGDRPGTTTADAQRIRELERDVREWKKANEILRRASAYFAQAELDRPWK